MLVPILIGAVLSSLAAAPGTQAPPAKTTTRLSPITVTATRIPTPAFDVPAAISVITRDQIRQGPPGASLAQTLARVPGLVAQNRQSYAQDLQLSLRGFGSRASFGVRGIRLLMDGLPLSLPDGQGETDPFDLAIAKRIEVLRGPFSTLYGNASGGVIQVFTEDGPAQPTFGAHLMSGSYGTRVERLQGGGTTGDFNYIANLSRFTTDGYRDHSAAEREHLYTKLRYTPSENTRLTFLFNAENQPYAQDPSGLTAEQVAENPRQAVPAVYQYDSGESHRHRQGGAVYEQQLGANDKLHATAWLGSRRVIQFLPFRGDGALSGGAVVDLDDNFGGGGARWTHQLNPDGFPLTLTAGMDYERLLERRKGFVNDNGKEGALRRNEDDVSSRLGEYLQLRWTLDRWVLSGGLRHSFVKFASYDHYVTAENQNDSGDLNFSSVDPVAGVLYKITPSLNLYANYGRGFQTPTFAELAYRPDGTAGLDFDLQPSTSDNYELGLKSDFGNDGKLRLALYKIDTDDEIVVSTSDNGRTTYRNAGTTTRKGVEFSLGSELGHGFHGYLALTWLEATFASGPFAGRRLPGVPRTTLYGALKWTCSSLDFYALADAQCRGRVYVDDKNTQAAASYLVAGLEAGFHQQIGGWRFREFARINNLFDRPYIGAVVVDAGNDRYFEPAPDRNYLLGMSASYRF